MSHTFDGTNTYLRIATAFGPPISLSLWFYPTDQVTVAQTLWISQNAGLTIYIRLRLNGATGVLTWELIGSGAGPPPPTASGVNFNKWNHVFCQTSGMKLALNGGTLNTGGADVGGTKNRRRVGASTVTVGAITTPSLMFTGNIAELMEADYELDDVNTDFRLRLAAGYHPLSVISSSSAIGNIRYFPFSRRLKDEFNHTTEWTDALDGWADHPPKMIHPYASKKIIKPFKLPLDWFNSGEEVGSTYEVMKYG